MRTPMQSSSTPHERRSPRSRPPRTATSNREVDAVSPTSHAYPADVVSRWFLDRGVHLCGLVLGRERLQVAALEHQGGNDGSDDEDQSGPQERCRVAMEEGG